MKCNGRLQPSKTELTSGYFMKPRIIIKTVKNFHCPKINDEVHMEYCTDLSYEPDKINGASELLIDSDCDKKDKCGIACQQDGKTGYDWSQCANPELRTTVRQAKKF